MSGHSVRITLFPPRDLPTIWHDVDRDCRTCGSRPGTYRTVTVGDGLSRRWSLCDGCVDAFREANWVRVDDADDPERVVLRVDPASLVGGVWRQEN